MCIRDRKFTLQELKCKGYECKDCKGNFIFIRTKKNAVDVAKKLEIEKKVLVHPYLSLIHIYPTVMYKKSIILGVGGYPEVKRKEDLELFLKIVFDGYYCENLKDVLLFYRSSKSNLKRRKSFINCIEYIQIMYNFLKLNKIGLNDFIYVVLGPVSYTHLDVYKRQRYGWRINQSIDLMR